eukprot:14932961-Heterocapsa_arctica.AAC.1
MQKLQKDGMIEDQDSKQFSEDLKQYRNKHCPAPQPLGVRGRKAKDTGSSSSCSRSHIVIANKKFPRVLPAFAKDFNNQDFNALLPDGLRASKEAFHGRWRLYWVDSAKSRSATWALHGWEGSIQLLLKEAWRDYENWTGHACPFGAALDQV